MMEFLIKNSFSNMMAYIFHSLNGVFSEPKFFILMESHLPGFPPPGLCFWFLRWNPVLSPWRPSLSPRTTLFLFRSTVSLEFIAGVLCVSIGKPDGPIVPSLIPLQIQPCWLLRS